SRIIRTVPGQPTAEVLDAHPYLHLLGLSEHAAPNTALAVCAPACWTLTGSGDNVVRLWELDSGHLLRIFEGHSAPVTCVAFAPDGKTMVSVGGEVRLWTLPQLPLVRSRAFAPGGSN